jgi:hypothetical protein|tara:strand:+ start:265 stop:510 length:246 start_codon:yes stop_codon:yes gene_type:complete
MFTVEFDHDNVNITIIDDSGHHEDIIIDAFDDIVYIQQHDQELDSTSIIDISPGMWEELIAAIDSPEGAFIKRKLIQKRLT